MDAFTKPFPVASIVLAIGGILVSLSPSDARPSHRFKELILHERIVPFDDSMAGDDYYEDLSDHRRTQINGISTGTSTSTSTEKIPVPVSHLLPSRSSASVFESSPQELLSIGGTTTTTIRGNRDNGSGETQGAENLDEDGGKVTEKGQGQGHGHGQGQTNQSVVTPPESGATSFEGVEDHDDIPKFHEPCRYVFCRVGRVCQPTPSGHGKCVCAGPDHCKRSTKKVCGNDGQVYPSHCELHRSACLKDIHISVDHSEEHCKGHLSNDSVTTMSSSSSESDLVDVSADKVSTADPKLHSASAQCTKRNLKAMISSLIVTHCSKLRMNESCTNIHDRYFVVSNLFSSFDQNGDKFLSAIELDNAEMHENLDKISAHCFLTDLLWSTSNSDRPGQISSTEFLAMFGVSRATLDRGLRVYSTSVTVGNSVELKCDVKGIDRIVWKRRDHTLEGVADKQIRVFDDGSLYIGDLKLFHMGNYTCHDRASSDVIQTHVLLVQTLPQVQVHPSTQIHLSGSTVMLRCHADGVPRPEILWEKNEWPLQSDDGNQQRYLFLHNNTVLEIKSADYKYDTGAYRCKAKNSAGTSDQVAAVFIENVATSKHSSYLKPSELFAVFHRKGYTVYEVSHCHTEHQVSEDFRGFRVSPDRHETLDTLCPNDSCSWADTVLVKDKFIYAAQPKLNRVVVIELDRSNPIEVIVLKCVPEKLDYLEQLDEVWVTCLHSGKETKSGASKKIVIIRQASSDHQHFPSDFPLTSEESSQVTGVFLPRGNSLKQDFEYGYVTHGNSMALKKLHLASVAYAKEIDLKDHGCIPASVQFIPIGGLVIVGCRTNESIVKPSFHLLLDYITDGLIDKLEVNGDSYLSPDARRVIVVGDGGNTAFVFKITDDGLFQHIFDEYTQLQLDGVAFFPSESGFDYDAFITTADQSTILHLDLETGRVSTMEGIEEAVTADDGSKSNPSRVIVGGGPFAEHLVTASNKSIMAVDGKRRRILCQWREVYDVRAVVPLPEYRRD